MSTTTVMRPTTTDSATLWSFTGGPTTVHGVLADDLDSTFCTSTGNNAAAQVGFGSFTMPAGAQIRSVGIKIRAAGTGGYFKAGVTFFGSKKVYYFTTGAKAPAGITAYDFKPASLAPDGYAWSAAIINRIKITLGGNTGIKLYRLELDVIYNEQPVVSNVTPSGTTSSPQFTVGWDYSDPDGDLAERWIVRIFDDPLPVGFNPETSPARMDSGLAYVGASQVTTWTIPKALPPGVYNIAVKAADQGSNGRYSQWAMGKVTVAGSPPAPPKLISVLPDGFNGRIQVIVEQTDNLLTLAEQGGEEQTGGFLRWAAVSGISSGPTVVAGTGIGGSNGIQATVSAATCQFRTPTGVFGRRVVGNRQYAFSGSIKNSVAAGTAHLDATWLDSSGAVISTSTGSTVTLSTSFQKSSNVVNAPANAFFVSLNWNGAGLTSGQVLTVDNNQIREDSVATTDYRGGLDSTNLMDPQDSTFASSSLTGSSWAAVGTGSLASVVRSDAYDGFELQYAPGTVGGSHTLKLGTSILLPVLSGPDANRYQVQFNARQVSGSGLKIEPYLFFTDANGLVLGAPTYGGLITLSSGFFAPFSVTATAPDGAVALYPTFVLSGEANTTDRWGFDMFGVIRVYFAVVTTQLWKPPSQVDTFALVEYSDDSGTTWAPVRFTENSLFDLVARQATVFDYEVIPNTSRMYRARTGVRDYQIDPVSGAQLSSAPSSSASATLTLTDFYILDPFTFSRMVLPQIGDIQLSSKEPQGQFEPLGRPYSVTVSDVPKGERTVLRLAFNSGAAYNAFEALRRTQHPLFVQTPSNRSWYFKLGEDRSTTWGQGTMIRSDGGAFVVEIPAVEVSRPA